MGAPKRQSKAQRRVWSYGAVGPAGAGLCILCILAGVFGPACWPWPRPYAAFVMDARTGEVIHARNADTPLHPASLTKMMTLYIAFQALERGEISLDTEVRISAHAASMPPSRLGLREGQVIRFRYLLRAAAIRSANDAATAIGEALAGSESAFAERMNATAAAMGMDNTHFVNMNGLTANGHLSTARDMSMLGRHLVYDFPQYYNLFSRRVADAGIAEVANTNRRFLDSYEGADGIKTGYTVAAGYNLVASAERNGVRIIATVFGGTSTANRNARIVELLDMGFAQARPGARVEAPEAPGYAETPEGVAEALVAAAEPGDGAASGRTIRVTGAVAQAPRPGARPGAAVADDDAVAAMLAAEVGENLDAAVDAALAEALGVAPPDEVSALEPAGDAPVTEELALAEDVGVTDLTNMEEVAAVLPADAEAPAEALPETALPEAVAEAVPEVVPEAPPAEIIMTAEAIMPEAAPEEGTEMVTRLSTSTGNNFGINLGRYPSRNEAERTLLTVALAEASSLMGGVRRVDSGPRGFDANVVGLSHDAAELACLRLQSRGFTCFMMGG